MPKRIGGVLGLRDFAETEPELTAWADARARGNAKLLDLRPGRRLAY